MDLTPAHLPVTARTLADVIILVEDNPRLTPTVRRDLGSDLRTMARLLGRHPSEIEAHPATLRAALRRVSPGIAGLSSKRFTNVRSNLARALWIARLLPRVRPRAQRTRAWQSIWDGIAEQHLKARLSRFIDYCCHRRIEPSGVNDTTLEEFRKHLDATSLYVDPKKVTDDAARALNRIAKEQGLPLNVLAVSKTGRYTTRPLEAYPSSFQEDLAVYEQVLTRADYFLEKGPTKPLKPASIAKIRSDIRGVLNAAVEAGVKIEHFASLANLVEERVIEAAFTWLTARKDGTPPVSLRDMAATLLAIAKYHVELPENRIRRLQLMRKKITKYDDGMSERNRRRLQQFDDWTNTRKLLCLPDLLLTRAKQSPQNIVSATDALYATAITILLACPMRIKNRAALDLDQHVTPYGSGSKLRYRISVPSVEVKNNVAIEAELQEDASKVMTQYLRHYRHFLVGAPTSALFPSANGGPRPPTSVGYGISNIIRKETGLQVHPHLFRHLAAKLYLETFHGDYESVRRQLGHKKHDTTVKFYAPIDNRRAQERFSQVVLEARKPRGRGR